MRLYANIWNTPLDNGLASKTIFGSLEKKVISDEQVYLISKLRPIFEGIQNFQLRLKRPKILFLGIYDRSMKRKICPQLHN